ncbi:rhomboid family intramembrane serine protease [Halosolutus amylolyticus]|uniref:Rhomboid family intramembrane serine protease n=1 Tax=Halosolutus amylolyticus TaxID=2932267 RepID=A0ABD5PQV0_9EURY|nr:rhomboid family intramembrane serine protease [Halosolutus amylolyticus]
MADRSPPRSGPKLAGRPEGPDPSTGSDSSPILELLAIFVIVFAVQALTAFAGAMAGLFVLAPPLADDPWTIVTSVYAHKTFGHLVSNSVALVLFGWPVARATTRVRFHTFVLVTGALAGISQIVVTGALASLPIVPGTPTVGVLGASGAVFALLGYLLTGNRLSDAFASVIDVPRWATLLVFLVLAAIVTLATARPGIALVAHFTGLLLGLVAGRAGVLEPRRGGARG